VAAAEALAAKLQGWQAQEACQACLCITSGCTEFSVVQSTTNGFHVCNAPVEHLLRVLL
jgi:hypothetical protein